MKTINSIVLLLATALTIPAFAQTTVTPHVGKRQAAQQKRIAEGVQSGDLTAKETAHLEMREAKIQADKKAAKADGVVTDAERAKLHAEQNHASRKIYNKKHNGRSAQ